MFNVRVVDVLCFMMLNVPKTSELVASKYRPAAARGTAWY